MFEKYAATAMTVGLVLLLLGSLWLLIRAFRHSWKWGLGSILFPPALLGFGWLHRARNRIPLAVLLCGLLLAGGTLGLSRLVTRFPPLGPRDKLVEGERHLTLTGWDRDDYAVLATLPDTVVLQMANPDVTDQTLENLRDLRQLRELDLNGSKITDAGLRVLAEFPALKILRIRGTAVTDRGFRESLMESPTLTELDARDTEISAKSLREWKNREKEVRKFLK
ncbi:MAG: hypothetical protein ACKOGA_25345 [Planctomycetaceae bacterium]